MTIPNTARKAGPLLGTGSQTAWPFTFKVFAAGDVQVTIANSSGTETLLVLGTDYTVTLNANQETSPGGTVNYPISGSALPVGSVLAIIGDLDYDQPLDLPSGGNFSPTALENQLDRSTMQIQQLREEMNRTAKLPPTSSESVEELVDDLQRLADSANNIDTLVANLADITTVANDLNEPVSEINTVAGAIANVNTVGNNIANVNTVAGISANVTSVAGNATNINAVAGNATNINAVNANKANIDTVAGIAANVTTVAGIAANVTTVAGNSANVNTVAGISAAVSAVAAIDDDVSTVADNLADVTNFADVYQGGKASDPTLRNDGSALQAGDLYFNTTEDALRAYSGSVWVSGTAGTLSVQNFSGNASTTAFTLATAPAGENNTQVYIGGVYQQKDTYSVSGTTLTFSSAPPTGTNNIEVVTVSTLSIGETDAALVSYTNSASGAVETTTRSKLDAMPVYPEEFGAIDTAINPNFNNAAALTAAMNSGRMVDGRGKTYKVVGTNIIDPYATAGVGYGASKAWFSVGSNITNIGLVGDVSFGTGANFLGKHTRVERVSITGDARFSAWYTTFQGITVSGITYINGDYPPDINWVGCYYNTFLNNDFGNVVVDQRYGPVNLNTFNECQFGYFLVKDSGNAGYGAGTQPYKDFHLNTFIGCEWTEGYTAPDGRTYSFVIDDSANVGGINRIISPYQEMTYRGFYGKGLEVDNIHNSGSVTGTYVGGPAGNARLGFQSPMSGEGGYIQRDVPHIYPAGQLGFGGDWSILNSSGYPVCLVPNNMTPTVGTDSTEPTGLGKAVTFSGGAFSAVDLVPQINANASPRTLISFAVIFKEVTGSHSFEVSDQSGSTIYGAANYVYLDNGWIMATGHSYGNVRMISGTSWSLKISAVSIGRGSGVISPFTQQKGNKPLLDVSGGSSYVKDAIATDYSTRGNYSASQVKTGLTNAASTDWYQVALGNFTGRSLHIRVQFSLSSGGGGVRNFYRESIINETGGATLAETNLHALSGANGSLSFVLSGSVLTVRTTTPVASAETGRMAIDIIGYDIPALVTAL